MQFITKLLWVLVPLVIFYPLGWFMRFTNNATSETFLIPSTLQGKFRVVYGENCGVTPIVQNGRQILEIPSDGILLVKPNLEKGWRDQEFYFVTPQGLRKLIYANNKKADKGKPNIFVRGPASATYNFDKEGRKSEQLTFNYVDFEISPRDTIYYEHNPENNRFDSMTQLKVIACRSNIH